MNTPIKSAFSKMTPSPDVRRKAEESMRAREADRKEPGKFNKEPPALPKTVELYVRIIDEAEKENFGRSFPVKDPPKIPMCYAFESSLIAPTG